MLCPRCNSENDTGVKFCKHCGAPLVDTELYLSQKEVKKKKKEKLKKELKEEREMQRKGRKTYSLNEKAYRRNVVGVLLSLVRSLAILVVLIIVVYFLGNFILVKYCDTTDNYSFSKDKVPSIRYVVGDRDLGKVEFTYEDGILYTDYIFEDMKDVGTDLTKYISYLISEKGYALKTEFNPTLEAGNVRVAASSAKTFESLSVIDIRWTKDSYTLKVYTEKEENLKELK